MLFTLETESLIIIHHPKPLYCSYVRISSRVNTYTCALTYVCMYVLSDIYVCTAGVTCCYCVIIGYMLEVDPEKRPNIWQVSEVVCRMRGTLNTLANVFVSYRIKPSLSYQYHT